MILNSTHFPSSGPEDVATLRALHVPDVRKIAIVRAGGLGDLVMALPAFDAVRAAYPGAETVLLGRDLHRQLLATRPGPVDRVLTVPRYPGVSAEEGVAVPQAPVDDFFEAMQREHFDLALQMHGGGKNSNPFVQRLGAWLTAGLRAANAPPLQRTVPYIYFQHETLRYLEVAALVGASPVTVEPRLHVTDEDRAAAERALPRTARPLVVFHPGVGAVERQWPPEKFAAVADALADAGGEIVVTGGEQERPTVEAMLSSMRAGARDLTGSLSLSGLVGLLERAAVVISNDTGPRHLAAAVGTPTVSIYWCFNMVTAQPLTRTYHRPLVSWQLTCPICGRSRVPSPCRHRVSYVADVPVEEVTEQARDLLQLATGAMS